MLLGSVTEAVLHQRRSGSHRPPHEPAAVSGGGHSSASSARLISRRLLALGLPGSRPASGRARHAVTPIEWLPKRSTDSAHFNVPEYRRYMVRDAQERLRAWCGRSRTWVDIDDAVFWACASRFRASRVEAKPADLIVMGAQGRGGIGLALFGSTTQQVVRGAMCPVLTVRGLPQS